ncbi:MAG TPA: alanyl-tRNA editing protein [Roseiarcus sp.]|nr:alanyl-tRNA editing protein [Roseiarcus sp.]
MTEPLFRTDPYARQAAARVVEAASGRVVLDIALFYPRGGGQPGDRGELILADGAAIAVADTVYDPDRATMLLVPAEGAVLPPLGEAVTARLDWPLRYARMRAHTALHLLSVALPYPVTGGSVGEAEGRLDFDSGEMAFDRAEIEARLNAMVGADAAVTTRWITDAELEANPGLVKTMKVKPPMGTGRVRLVEIAGLDLQPCGGTHVARLSEIGRIEVTGIEKKGKQNRRVRIRLPDPAAAG